MRLLNAGKTKRKLQREPICLLRLAGKATEVFDDIRLMATEEPVPEFMGSIIYEGEPDSPFPLRMTPGDWLERLLKARRKVSDH